MEKFCKNCGSHTKQKTLFLIPEEGKKKVNSRTVIVANSVSSRRTRKYYLRYGTFRVDYEETPEKK